jgi:16S rRNA (uracil1498-N3)-methyltransferase
MLTLFFVDDLPRKVGSTYEFDSDDAQHAIRVLRISAGEVFMLSDGEGAWSEVKVFAVKKKSLEVQVLSTGFQEPLRTSITVVQAIPKGDRAKEAIELLTEAGVDTIIPWASSRSIGKGSDKFENTAREASKQSRRLRIPRVVDSASTDQICALIKQSSCTVVFHESASSGLSELKLPLGISDVVIIIGPEGGITDEELTRFTDAGAMLSRMGRPVLRSAHAGIAAVSALCAKLQVW